MSLIGIGYLGNLARDIRQERRNARPKQGGPGTALHAEPLDDYSHVANRISVLALLLLAAGLWE